MGPEGLTPTKDWALPEEFDGFQVRGPLGRGGMGHVYLGHDLALDRPVALKLIGTPNLAPGARERFLIEARAIARLQHPNVVGIYRVGDVLGRPYIAYELVDGASLDKVALPLAWGRALDIGIAVARGLAAAHRRNVLHRDIKPGNVMLAETGEVKLLDFGLAKLLDLPLETLPRGPLSRHFGATLPWEPREAEGHAATQPVRSLRAELGTARAEGPEADARLLTVTGQFLGTPLYMAPELWLGEPATAASDIYALGLMLYELLSGRLPFAQLRPEELARAAITRDLPLLAKHAADVPYALADVIDRCVRRLPDERYRDVEQVTQALEAVKIVYQPFAPAPSGRPGESADDAVRVAASFARIAPRGEAFAVRLYERLFARHPELRKLFPADLAEQRQKLMGALQLVVENLKLPERLTALLEDLGRRHVSYGVEPHHLDALGEALLATLSELEGERFSVATEQAWARAYAGIAEAMQRGLGDERPTPPPTNFRTVAYQHQIALDPPPTRYTGSGDVNIAYQVFGAGPPDLVLALGWVTHLEVGWQSPQLSGFLRRLGSFSRVILFDKRGTGLSDRRTDDLGPDDRVHDVLTVMDAAASERAVVFGISEAAGLAALFAAKHPERTLGLVAYGGSPCMSRSRGYEHGLPAEVIESVVSEIGARWGQPLFAEQEAPSLAKDEAFHRWWATYLRSGAAPSGAAALFRTSAALDARGVLSQIRVPTLVLHRKGDPLMPIAASRDLARGIAGARMVELEGRDRLPYAGDADALLDEVERFAGALGATAPEAS